MEPRPLAIRMFSPNSSVGDGATGGGVQLNAVPQDGGNTFSVYFSGSYTNEHLSSKDLPSNVTARGAAVTLSGTRGAQPKRFRSLLATVNPGRR